jgi:hypothetical protein
VETYKNVGATEEQTELYRFQLALTINATLVRQNNNFRSHMIFLKVWNRRYHYAEVAIGNQYDIETITVLRRLNNYGLVDTAIDFTPFKNLEEINLSGYILYLS